MPWRMNFSNALEAGKNEKGQYKCSDFSVFQALTAEIYCVFPYNWKGCMLKRGAVQGAQELDTEWSKVFEVMDSQSLCSWGGGVFAVLDGFACLFGKEWCCIGKPVLLNER